MQRIFDDAGIENMYNYGLKYFKDRFSKSLFIDLKKEVHTIESDLEKVNISKEVFKLFNLVPESEVIKVLRDENVFFESPSFNEFVKQMRMFLAECYFLLAYLAVFRHSQLAELVDLYEKSAYYSNNQKKYVTSLASHWLVKFFGKESSDSSSVTEIFSEVDELSLSKEKIDEWYHNLKMV